MLEAKAILRYNGSSAPKMRQMADLVRGKDVVVALHALQFVTKAAAKPMSKLIQSAVANAREKANAAEERFDADLYFVKAVQVNEGPTMKRFRPRAQGRAYRIRKRTCHVELVLGAHAGTTARRKRVAAGAAAAATPVATAAAPADKKKRTRKAAAAAGA